MPADRCVIVVKAQPHRSSNYFETVCSAGVGEDGRWRRQYPVPFRILADGQKYRRWEWITYEFREPENDRRRESQKVVPESIATDGTLKRSERSRLLGPLIREGFAEADARGESLTLLRPQQLEFSWAHKSDEEIISERTKHAALAQQLSFFDTTAKPLEPCPYEFYVTWRDFGGKTRRHVCDDWESVAAYARFCREYGEVEALRIIADKYESVNFKTGLALAFSTHSRRNATYDTRNQWLLVGIIRLDDDPQGQLAL